MLLAAVLAGGCAAPAAGPLLEVPEAFARDGELTARQRDARRLVEDLSAPELRSLVRVGEDVVEEELRALADADPTWVAPRRALDDLARADLRGARAWARRAAAWQADGTARDAYLLGRLESPERAAELFAEAVARDPDLAWGWHGLAVSRANAGAPWREVDGLARRAAERATSLPDLVQLTRVRVRLLTAAGSHGRAIELARGLALHPGLAPDERAGLEALAVAAELQGGGLSISLTGGIVNVTGGGGGLLAGLELLAPGSGLTDPDAVSLARVLLRAPSLGRSRVELQRALVAALDARRVERDPEGGSDTVLPRFRLAEDLQAELDDRLLDAAVVPGAVDRAPIDHAERLAAARFRAGDLDGWVAAWEAGLPERVRALRTPLGERAGVTGQEGAVDALGLAAAAEDLGWYDAALALHARAAGLRRLEQLEAGDPLVVADHGPGVTLPGKEQASWDLMVAGEATPRASLLDELDQLFARSFDEGDLDGLLADVEDLVRRTAGSGHGLDPEGVAASPLDTYGPFARLVTPLTPDDAPAPGLQALLAELGRVAIVGEQFGSLDGTVRPLVAVEPIAGAHLGAPYAGTVLWCGGVDVPSRAERAGASIAGSAVFDGYWVDLDVLRSAAEGWRRRADDLRPRGPGGWRPGQVDEVPRAPAVLPGHAADRRVPLLGEADRLAFVLLAERAGVPPSIDELLDAVAVHEEGHLCDRARFLPLAKNWWPGLRFFAACGFSPSGMLERLEYRAQAVALAVVDDPRLALWEMLELGEAAEARGGTGVTPHGSAYAHLLDDLVDLIAERGPGSVGLDPDRYLRWQLHALDPEVLRELAVELAAREGLVGDAPSDP